MTDPCRCGSGEQHRLCCALSGPARERLAEERALHLKDRELLQALFDQVPSLRSPAWFGQLVEEFFECREPDERRDLFAPWVLTARHGSSPSLLEQHVSRQLLPAETRAWLDAQAQGWLSIWCVIDVCWEEGVAVRDLLTCEERTLADVAASMELHDDEHLLARIVDFEGRSYLCGGYPAVLPPPPAEAIAREFCRTHGDGGPLPSDLLRGAEPQRTLIRAWHGFYAEGEVPPGMECPRTRSGEPLLYTRDHFSFRPGQRNTVLRRLRALGLFEFEVLPEVTLFAFLDPKVAGAVLGEVQVERDKLRIETNSLAQADSVRAVVTERLGSMLVPVGREHSDPVALARKPTRRR